MRQSDDMSTCDEASEAEATRVEAKLAQGRAASRGERARKLREAIKATAIVDVTATAGVAAGV
eukprot:CAMPEP_0118947284 /NCGR_PEP_ID=MMETSP1169-20130426/45732_1 /TAXON_ID=36882 /ORGANISM="Pyramimonas obovata, Strain CCMP722" /LENGTH=62 /DNA_ID=CAMNT_0006893467 /DNA_START=59 /DNA_END=244 /DNA_ORIENTATION=+